MGKFAVSFRFEDGTYGGYTCGERYGSFMTELRKTGAWEETTSFAITTSTETAEQLCDRLYYKSYFIEAVDLMIVVNIESGAAVTRGPIKYPATLRGKLNSLVQK